MKNLLPFLLLTLLAPALQGAAMEKSNIEQQHDAAIALALEWGIAVDDQTLNQTDSTLTLAQRLALDKSNVEKARKQLQQQRADKDTEQKERLQAAQAKQAVSNKEAQEIKEARDAALQASTVLDQQIVTIRNTPSAPQDSDKREKQAQNMTHLNGVPSISHVDYTDQAIARATAIKKRPLTSNELSTEIAYACVQWKTIQDAAAACRSQNGEQKAQAQKGIKAQEDLLLPNLPSELQALIRAYCFNPILDFFPALFQQLPPITGLHNADITGPTIAVTADGNTVITESRRDRIVKVWNKATEGYSLVIDCHTAAVPAVAITPDGSIIVTGSHDTTTRVTDGKTGHCTATFHGSDKICSVAITADGSTIITADAGRIITIYDRINKQSTSSMNLNNKIDAITLTADETALVARLENQTIIWQRLPEPIMGQLWQLSYEQLKLLKSLVFNLDDRDNKEPIRLSKTRSNLYRLLPQEMRENIRAYFKATAIITKEDEKNPS